MGEKIICDTDSCVRGEEADVINGVRGNCPLRGRDGWVVYGCWGERRTLDVPPRHSSKSHLGSRRKCTRSRKSPARLEITCQHVPMAHLWDLSPPGLRRPNIQRWWMTRDSSRVNFSQVVLAPVKGVGKQSYCYHERERMKSTLVVLKFVHKFSDIPLFKR